jgi:hypothetical protein
MLCLLAGAPMSQRLRVNLAALQSYLLNGFRLFHGFGSRLLCGSCVSVEDGERWIVLFECAFICLVRQGRAVQAAVKESQAAGCFEQAEWCGGDFLVGQNCTRNLLDQHYRGLFGVSLHAFLSFRGLHSA